jgi:hypothetical protein
MTDKPTDLFGTIEIATDRQDKVSPTRSPRSPSKKKRGAPKKAKGQRKGGLFWVGIVGMLFAGYSTAGYLLVPYLFKTLLPEHLENTYSLELSQESVRFNPFTFTLGINGLSVKTLEDGETAEPLLRIAAARTNLDLLSLLRGDFVSNSIEITGLDLRIVRREDKSYNISYLLADSILEDQSEIINFAELPFLFSLNNIEIADSRIVIYDRKTQKDHLIEDIELALPVIANFDYQNKFYIQPRFSAAINGSPISLTGGSSFGTTNRDSSQTQLSYALNDIDIPLYFDYLPVSLPVDITKGTANGSLHLTFTPEQESGSKVKIEFNLVVAPLYFESRDSKLSLEIPEARFEGTLEPFANTLSFQSILLREPAVISQGKVSRETLANLLPLTQRPGPEDRLHQVIPGLSIKLLIADGGSFNILNSKGKKVPGWENLQLSLKNFSNQAGGAPEEKQTVDERSFRLSGEHQASSAIFTWQGTFDDQNQPGGNLQLNNIPVARVAPFLGRKSSDISGTAELSGLMSIHPSTSDEAPFDYSLKSTRLTVKELRLKDRGTIWLRAPVLRSEPVSRINGITDLGNVFLQNSTMVIDRQKLPYLFQVFGSQPSQHILHGLDFSGSVKIIETKSPQPILDLKTVIFQANKLEQKQIQKDNFVFSAQLRTAEDIQAKGSFHIRPVQLTTQLSAANLTPSQAFSWFTDSKTLLTSNGLISATGEFRYPEQEFSGEMSVARMRIGDPNKPVIRADSLTLKDFAWSRTRQNIALKQLIIDQPEFSWRRLKDDQDGATLTSIFLRHIFLPEPDPAAKDPDLDLSSFGLAIGQINFTDGAISFTDERTQPPLSLGLTGLNGSLLNLAYPVAKSKSAISLTGNIEGNPFSIEGEGNLLQLPPSIQATFSTKNMPLSLFTKQIERKIKAIDVSEARVDVTLNGTWNEQGDSSQLSLVINGVAPKKAGSSSGSALAVLSGEDGAISKRFESNSTRSGRPVLNGVLDHYTRLMIKGALDPMLVAGPDFKDLIEQQYVSFQPGTDRLTGESMERLGRYSQFLAAHPLIALHIAGLSDVQVDSPVLKSDLMQAEQARVDTENKKRADEWHKKQMAKEKARKALLKSQQNSILETDLTKADTFVPLKPRPVTVTNRMLRDLALQRERTVQTYLTEQLSIGPDRIKVNPADTKRIKNDGSSARVLIGLTDQFDAEKS